MIDLYFFINLIHNNVPFFQIFRDLLQYINNQIDLFFPFISFFKDIYLAYLNNKKKYT